MYSVLVGVASQPTPRLATRPGPFGGYHVIDLARSLHSYALAP